MFSLFYANYFSCKLIKKRRREKQKFFLLFNFDFNPVVASSSVLFFVLHPSLSKSENNCVSTPKVLPPLRYDNRSENAVSETNFRMFHKRKGIIRDRIVSSSCAFQMKQQRQCKRQNQKLENKEKKKELLKLQ